MPTNARRNFQSFVLKKINFSPIFEFPAKYEQKVKKIIGHSEEKTSSSASSQHGDDMICALWFLLNVLYV